MANWKKALGLFFLTCFGLVMWANGAFGQDSLNLSRNPDLVFSPQFSASSCHLGDYYLGDDVFNVVYDPIVSTSFAYRQLPLSEQIREVEIQGGVFWMEDGSGLFIRNGRIAEFRFNSQKLSDLGWTPEKILAQLGKMSEKRSEQMLEDGPVDSYLYFWGEQLLRFRLDAKESSLLELAIGCRPDDPVWD